MSSIGVDKHIAYLVASHVVRTLGYASVVALVTHYFKLSRKIILELSSKSLLISLYLPQSPAQISSIPLCTSVKLSISVILTSLLTCLKVRCVLYQIHQMLCSVLHLVKVTLRYTSVTISRFLLFRSGQSLRAWLTPASTGMNLRRCGLGGAVRGSGLTALIQCVTGLTSVVLLC